MQLWESSSKELLLMNKLEVMADTSIDEFTKNFITGGGVIKTIYEISENFRINEGGKWVVVGVQKLIDILNEMKGEGGEVKLTKKSLPEHGNI